MNSIAQNTTNHKQAVTRANRIRGATNLDSHPDFGRVGGEYFTYIAEGFEFRLRFDYMWTITCAGLGIEFQFQCLNQPPEDIAGVIREKLAEALPDPDGWLTENLAEMIGEDLAEGRPDPDAWLTENLPETSGPPQWIDF